MKSDIHSPGTGAAAAHRQQLDREPSERNERAARAGTDQDEVFRDLRRRNERRARLAEARRNR